jgi:hypothetical protein
MAGVLPPLALTDAMLTSSTAAEPGVGEAAWTTGATFAAGDRAILGSPTATVTMTIASPGVVTWTANGLPNGAAVVLTTSGALPTGLTAGAVYYVLNRTTNTFQLTDIVGGAPIVTSGSQSGTHTGTAQIHRVYESLVGTNSGNPPAVDDGTKWLEIGPTNRWAALDLERNTRTWSASPYTNVLTPGQRVDALFLGNLVANAVTITITSSAVTVYSATIDLNDRPVFNWYDYFFKRFATKPTVLKLDLPPYTNAIITITITRTSGLVGCGSIVIGSQEYLGTTQHGAESEARNFSKIERTEYGELAELVKRRSVPKSNQTIRFDKSRTRAIQELIEALNAMPAVWYGLDEDDSGYFEALLILGIYKVMKLNLAHAEHGLLTAEYEEI